MSDSVFNPDGSYKETYRKELNRKIKHNFHGYVPRDRTKENFFKHKSYDEFLDFNEFLKDLKPTKNKDNTMRGRPKTNKQPNKEIVEAMTESVTNKTETVDDIEQETIIVDSIQSEVKMKPVVKNTKSYKFKDVETLKGMNELVVVLSYFTQRLHDKEIISLNAEELKILDRGITNPTQTYIFVLKLLLNKFTSKGILEFTDEEFYDIANKYKEFLIY